jgi:type IV pilus assembly protein PilQ
VRGQNLLEELTKAVRSSNAGLADNDSTDQAELPLGNGSEVRVTDRGTVELHVADLPLSTVLRLLSIEGRRNIVTSPNVRGTVTANLYNVTFEEALDAVLMPNGAGYRQVGQFVYVYTRKELQELSTSPADRLVTRVYRLNYITAEDAENYFKAIVGDEGTIGARTPEPGKGIESQPSEAGGASNSARDFIMVTAKPAKHAEIESFLKDVDVQPQQVLVEATILRARLNNDHALGIDFTLVGGVDLELLGATSRAITDLTLGDLPQDRLEKFNSIAETDFRGNVPSGGITFGVIKDHVAMFLRALEQVTDTVVVANPKVLALNKQKGQVIVGQRDGYLTTTVTETQAIQTVEFLETGTSLVFRPFIANDGRIRIELYPKDSVGFISAQGLPSEQTTEVSTNVIVRDGETILIGGLFREVTTDSRSQVPALGNIPILGLLFRSKNESTNREEVIILLTINIVKDEDAYAESSRIQWENVERLRVGIREGLMWTGRERLAQAHYRHALDALAQDDQASALWHTKLALHNNPRFMPAIELRERLAGERAWAEDGTGGREFVYRLIARERGYPIRPFGRQDPTENERLDRKPE